MLTPRALPRAIRLWVWMASARSVWPKNNNGWQAINAGALSIAAELISSPAQRNNAAFSPIPTGIAPVISGNDIVLAMEKGESVPGMREHGVFYNNHIFLFADEASLEKFSKNPAFYANQVLEAIQASNHTAQQLR